MRERARRCLVLGGSGFVGRAVCRELLGRGASVAFTFHEDRAAAAALEAAGALPIQAELATAEGPTAAVDEAARLLGGLDALVHCAARGGPASGQQRLGDIDAAAWDEILDVNLRSAFLACRQAAPILRAAGGGDIVLLGSLDGVKPAPAPVHYAASKAALGGLAMALAKELGPDRVRVNVLAPGVLAGGLSRSLPAHLRADYVAHCALGREGTAEDVARIAGWLACENSYVSGQVIAADGGI